MGAVTDAKIAAWQKEAGIEPAHGDQGEALEKISRLAYELIQLVELERSGIRDGDGGAPRRQVPPSRIRIVVGQQNRPRHVAGFKLSD